jgi:hypothetical protein
MAGLDPPIHAFVAVKGANPIFRVLKHPPIYFFLKK